MAADTPKIALYVSSVPGRLVSRPGSPHSYIGAEIPTPDERKAGKRDCTWHPERVVPVLQDDYERYLREWDALTRDGDLLKRSEADFVAYQKKVEADEKKAEAERKKAEAEANKSGGNKPEGT